MKAIVTLLVLALAAPVAAQNLDAYSEQSRAERAVALALCQAGIKKIGRRRGTEAVTLREKIEQRIKYLEDPAKPYFAVVDFNWESPEIGTVGRIDQRLIDVAQVIDKRSAMVSFPHYTEKPTLDVTGLDGRFYSERGSVEGTGGRSGTKVILRKIATDGWVDGEGRKICGVFSLKGTETYNTAVGGTNTVFVLECLDPTTLGERFTMKGDMRTWTAKSGKSTEAIFVSYDRGKVKLMNAAGKTVDVELSALSDADKDYVRDRIALNKAITSKAFDKKPPTNRARGVR